MSEVLSQAEIDALISAIHTGEVGPEPADDVPTEARPIRAYDFRRPDRFSKDQLRTISMIHGIFARLAAMALSVQLRFPVTATLRTVDQLAYEEFVRSVPQPTVLLIIGMTPLEGKAMIEFSNAFALLMVDRLLGGAGKSSRANRSLTDVERLLVGRVADKLLPALREAWHSILDIAPTLAGMESNPQFAQIASPGDIILLITVEIQTPHQAASVNLCLPYLLLQPVLGRLSATTLFRAAVHTPRADAVRAALDDTTVPLRVELGRARVSLGELAELERHDVIQLDRPYGAPLDLFVGDCPLFKARPGRVRRRLAVEIAASEVSAR